VPGRGTDSGLRNHLVHYEAEEEEEEEHHKLWPANKSEQSLSNPEKAVMHTWWVSICVIGNSVISPWTSPWTTKAMHLAKVALVIMQFWLKAFS